MRLIKIKLLDKYKIFQKDQEFSFGENSIIGIVGINGSGKSILLELISNVFIEASNQITQESYLSTFGYEMTYTLKMDHMIHGTVSGIGGNWEGSEYVTVRMFSDKTVFKMWISNGLEEFEINKINHYYVFLPRKVVVYSSGHNEGVSDEIINYKLYSLIEKDSRKIKKNGIGEVINKGVLDRYNEVFFYFDDIISKLAILTAFLFKTDKADILSQFIDRVLVKSFKLRIDRNDIYGEEIYFDDKAAYLLNEILKLDYTVHTNENGFEYSEFLIGENAEKASFELLSFFEGLQRLHDYNIYKVKKKTRKKIICGKEIHKKSLIDWNVANHRVFELLEMTLKVGDKPELNLKDLSDGEYQVLQIMSIMSIFSGGNILFLLDEPETHFNPSWKSLFVSNLHSLLDADSQIVFTSHNPEVITDLPRASVVSMKSGIQYDLQIETFGANPNMISANLFDKRNTVSKLAKNKIDEFRDKINHMQTREELEILKTEIEKTLGDSSERLMLIIEIQKKVI